MKDLKDMYQMKRNAINARQAATTGHVAGNQAMDREKMPVMKDQIAKLIDVISTPKQRTPLQMQIKRRCNIELKDDKAWETLTRNQTMEDERSKKFVIGESLKDNPRQCMIGARRQPLTSLMNSAKLEPKKRLKHVSGNV